VPEVVPFRPKAEPRVEVKLSRAARRVIGKECLAVSGQVETGGALLTSSIRTDRIELDGATGPGPNGRQAPDGMNLDFGYYDDHEAWLRRVFESTPRLAGIWHTHPLSCRGRPSEGDLRVFARLLDQTDGDYIVAIIATPKRSLDGSDYLWWSTPELTAWTVRRLHSGQAVCEPARLV
jgi:hypothetical protein